MADIKLVGCGKGKPFDVSFLTSIKTQTTPNADTCEIVADRFTIDCVTCSEKCRCAKCVACFAKEDHSEHWWLASERQGEMCSCVQLQNPFRSLSRAEFYKVFEHADIICQSVLKSNAVDLGFFDNSPILVRAASIYMLLSSDGLTLERLFQHQDDPEALLFSDHEAVSGGLFRKKSFFLQLVDVQGRQSEQLLCSILTKDRFFRSAALRQIAPALGKILEGPASALVSMCLEGVQEQSSLKTWGFYEALAKPLQYELEYFAIKKDKKRFITFMGVIKQLTFVDDARLPFEFLQTIQSVEQVMRSFSVDPDGRFDYAQKITEPLECSFLYAQVFQKNLIKAHASVESLAKLLGRVGSARSGFVATPSVLMPAFIINSAEAMGKTFAEFVETVRLQSGLTRHQFSVVLLQQLVEQQLANTYCQLGLEYAQNWEDIAHFVEVIDGSVELKYLHLLGLHFTQQMILRYPEEAGQLVQKALQKYQRTPQVQVHYASSLEHLRRPALDAETLERMLHNLHTAPVDIPRLLITKGCFTTTHLREVLSRLLKRTPSYDRFHSVVVEVADLAKFDPIYYWKADDILQAHFQTGIPREIETPSFCAGVLAAFPEIYTSANDVLEAFENSKATLSVAMLAARILRTIGQKPALGAFKAQQLNDLLIPKVETQHHARGIDIRSKMASLRTKGDHKRALMTEGDVGNTVQAGPTEEICNMCHGPLGKQWAVPAIVQVCIYNNMQLPYFCKHKYHIGCIHKLRQETLECACCGFPAATWYEMGVLGRRTWFEEEARLLYYLFEQIDLQDPLAYAAVLKELDKARFMYDSAADKTQFENTSTEIDRIKHAVFEGSSMKLEELFLHLKRTVFSNITHKDLVLDASIFPDSTKLLLARFQRVACKVCNGICSLTAQSPPVQCLKCHDIFHFGCTLENNEFHCPRCRGRFAFHPAKLVIYRNHKTVIRAPYVNFLGQFVHDILGEEKTLQRDLLNELKIMLLCGHSQKFDNDFLERMGFTQIMSDAEFNVMIRRMDEPQFLFNLRRIHNDPDLPAEEKQQRIRRLIEIRQGAENEADDPEVDVKSQLDALITELRIRNLEELMCKSDREFIEVMMALHEAPGYHPEVKKGLAEIILKTHAMGKIYLNLEHATPQQIESFQSWASQEGSHQHTMVLQKFNARLQSIAAQRALDELRQSLRSEMSARMEDNETIVQMKSLIDEGFDLQDVWECVTCLPDAERDDVISILQTTDAVPELKPFVAHLPSPKPSSRPHAQSSPLSPTQMAQWPVEMPIYRQEPLQRPTAQEGGEDFY